MQDDFQQEKTVADLLAETGFSSYEDLASVKLSNCFRPREYAVPALSEEAVRRGLRRFESHVTPNSQIISFLGAGIYDCGQSAGGRMENLLCQQATAPRENDHLQKLYLSCARTLTGMEGICPEALTAYEAWKQVIRWITVVRPGRCTVLVAETVNPVQREQIRRMLPRFGLVYEELPTPDGVLSPALLLGAIHENTAAILVSSPNYLGCIESTSELGQIAHQRGALMGVIVDLLSLYVVRTPEEYRANFCVADWGTLGVVPSGVRQRSWMWGVQTLQQETISQNPSPDLRATMEIAARLLALRSGTLHHRFMQSWSHAHFLREALAQMPECRIPQTQPFFREFVVRVPGLAEQFIEELEDQGIFPGVALGRDGFPKDWLLISTFENHQAEDLAYFLKAFKQALERRAGKTSIN